MSKMGRLDISNDEQYDELYARYQHKKKNTQDTIKQFKQVSENLHALSLSISQLVQGIANTYENSDPIHPHIEQMSRALEQFDENYVQLFQKEVQFNCVDNVTNYIAELEAPKQMLLQRDKAKIEYDEKSTQMKKLMESKKPNAAQKMPLAREKLQHAESLYNTTRHQAKKQMADLINAHGRHMDPVLVSMNRSVASLAGGMNNTLGQYDSIAETIEGSPLKRQQVTVEAEESSSVGEMQNFGSESHDGSGGHTPFGGSSGTSTTAALQRTSYPSHSSMGSAPPPPPTSREIPPEFNSEWYYLDENLEQKGPYDFHDMRRMFQSLTINDSTHVFGGEMSDWQEIAEVVGLKMALS
eukprot:CAMPEP_0117445168 /NCGR_PEP_ID=MMETSP0759-20121206/5647_1 /TAXON_ID=63605 /ORGANISM="Percolomonas cosmopolitus, Strain WS" /LENGTH=354 /DNA_ID=CAMNT_0005237317 /DNA_START=108 /DNA_END=1172 /DNA_ORIENTATION=+